MLINSEIISSDARLLELVNSSSELNHIGLDLESNGFHRYQECVCLLQLCIKNKIYLIDTFAIGEIEPQRKILENTTENDFYRSKLITALFYAENILPEATSSALAATGGAAAVTQMQPEYY